MARHLGPLPGGQPAIKIGELTFGALVEHAGLAVAPACAQRRSARRQRLDRPFERQICAHTVIAMPR